MCVSLCHRRKLLYFNHEDCLPIDCEYAGGEHGRCADCTHRQGQVCGLTHDVLPPRGGCCHCNVPILSGDIAVTPEMVSLLDYRPGSRILDILAQNDVYYIKQNIGPPIVNPDYLASPVTYGYGTEPSLVVQPEPVTTGWEDFIWE